MLCVITQPQEWGAWGGGAGSRGGLGSPGPQRNVSSLASDGFGYCLLAVDRGTLHPVGGLQVALSPSD